MSVTKLMGFAVLACLAGACEKNASSLPAVPSESDTASSIVDSKPDVGSTEEPNPLDLHR